MGSGPHAIPVRELADVLARQAISLRAPEIGLAGYNADGSIDTKMMIIFVPFVSLRLTGR